MAKSKEHI